MRLDPTALSPPHPACLERDSASCLLRASRGMDGSCAQPCMCTASGYHAAAPLLTFLLAGRSPPLQAGGCRPLGSGGRSAVGPAAGKVVFAFLQHQLDWPNTAVIFFRTLARLERLCAEGRHALFDACGGAQLVAGAALVSHARLRVE